LRARIRLVQQCRPEDFDKVRQRYTRGGVVVELAPFFADLPRRLAAAHLVIGRAGASTVAELATIGRPSILVPYPYAADDHQTANARAFEAAGGCSTNRNGWPRWPPLPTPPAGRTRQRALPIWSAK
jgi:UDP-N-acetylglucosamine--N-acetylmuramyl-(pentapeptide) pyrophosphoryl-undecaprenol N-acetylglucosamine transferase